MVAIAEQAKMRFSNPDDKPIEKLSIGCSSYYQILILSKSLHELGQAHPNLHPRLSVVPQEQLYQQLDTGSADVVFDIREGTKESGKLTFKQLCQSPIVCVGQIDHPLAKIECVSSHELRSHPLIFCNPINLIPEIAKLQWKLAEQRHPADMHFCDSIEAAVVLAGAGFGLAVLPEMFIPPESKLVSIKLADAPNLSFGAFYKPYPGDDLLKEFIQIIKKNLNPST